MSNRTQELSDMVDTLTAANVEQAKVVANLTTERDTFKAQAEAGAKTIEELKAKMEADANAAADVLQKEMNARIAVQEELKRTQGERDTAKAALANPAFAAAAVQGGKAVAEGGAESRGTMTQAEAEAKYRTITDPHERKQFRADHAEELKLK